MKKPNQLVSYRLCVEIVNGVLKIIFYSLHILYFLQSFLDKFLGLRIALCLKHKERFEAWHLLTHT